MSSFVTTTHGVRLRPAEAVAAGHPDKIADAIADAIVDLAIGREPRALVGVEVAVHRASVFVTGRAAGARLRAAGHRAARPRAVRGARPRRRLAAGPRRARDRLRPRPRAARPGRGRLPRGVRRPVDLHRVRRGLARDGLAAAGALARPPDRAGTRGAPAIDPELRIGPDAKAAVLGAEAPGLPMALEAATVSLQQAVGADEILTRRQVVEVVRAAMEAAPGAFEVPSDLASRVLVNGAGNFECGGPNGDNGLSGKKLVVDAYGPRVPDRRRRAVGQGLLQGGPCRRDRGPATGARRRPWWRGDGGDRRAAVAPGRPGGAGGRGDGPGRGGHRRRALAAGDRPQPPGERQRLAGARPRAAARASRWRGTSGATSRGNGEAHAAGGGVNGDLGCVR